MVTIKGTIKWSADNFSKGTNEKDAKAKYIAGKFKEDLNIWILRLLVLNTINFFFKMYGVIIINPKKNRRNPEVKTFNSNWDNFKKTTIVLPKKIEIIIKNIA